jgi:hypothetical protein
MGSNYGLFQVNMQHQCGLTEEKYEKDLSRIVCALAKRKTGAGN